MGPAELTEGEFAGVNADAYVEVAAGRPKPPTRLCEE